MHTSQQERSFSSMAEQSKFAGALGRLNHPASEPMVTKSGAAVKKPATESMRAVVTSTSGAGRGGKRSDPAFSPTTFFVRKETKKQAVRLLLDDIHGGKDLSDLV